MKYTILGFQQQKLIENNLTVEDAFILRTIKDMYSSASMEFKDFNGIKYMWINYTYLLNQIPIMGSKRNLMRKIEKYGNELLLLRNLEKERNGVRGNYSYISPTPKLDGLQDYDLMTETHKGYDKNDIRVMTESHNKDTSIKDTSIKDNNNNNKKKGFDSIINSYTNNEKLKTSIIEFIKMRKAIKKPLTDNALEIMLKKLNKLSSKDNEKVEILEQSIMGSWQGIFELKAEVKAVKHTQEFGAAY